MRGMLVRLGRCMPARITLGVAVASLGLAGGACSRIILPPELPNRTDDGEFHMRWALVREPQLVRAVGVIETPSRNPSWVTLGLYGADRDGRTVSLGENVVQGGFGRLELPFEVTLRPTGREERFVLHVIRAADERFDKD